MNNSIKVKPEDTLNVVKNYIIDNYGYQDATARAITHKGCNDYRDYEPDRIEIAVTAKKDLGLGIGESEVIITLDEKEISAIIMKRLGDQNVDVDRIEFSKTRGVGYYDEDGITFTGTTIHLKTLDELKNINTKEYYR